MDNHMPEALTTESRGETDHWDAEIDRLMSEEENVPKGCLIGLLIGLAIWAVVLGVLCWYWNS